MELLNSEYLWLYAVLTTWLVVALFLAYKETIKNHHQFLLGSFFALTFQYTVMFAITLISTLSDGKNGNSSNNATSSNKTITNVRFKNGYITVFYKYGDRTGSYSVACAELVNWNGQSVTVKVISSSQKLVKTMNATGAVIDTYNE